MASIRANARKIVCIGRNYAYVLFYLAGHDAFMSAQYVGQWATHCVSDNEDGATTMLASRSD